MIVQIGLQPNCSEVVYQICGVTKEAAQKIKEVFINILKDKYKEDYLNSYAEGLFAIKDKYHLALYTYDGSQNIDDWDALCKAAKEIGFESEYVDCCSNPISSDEEMERHLKWKKERKR